MGKRVYLILQDFQECLFSQLRRLSERFSYFTCLSISTGNGKDDTCQIMSYTILILTLYSLADFIDEDGSRIRKDESYEKNYLLGKYGEIPSLKKIDILREE